MTKLDRQCLCPDATSQLLARLLAEHGELMSGQAIQSLLKYPSDRAFRRAVAAGSVPVPVFRLLGRMGWFAKTQHVGEWLEELGGQASIAATKKGGSSA